jgi:hypothetical protein
MANIIYLKKIRQLWSTNPPISTKQITISHPNLLEIQVPGLGMAHNVVSLYWFLAWDIMWYLYTGSWNPKPPPLDNWTCILQTEKLFEVHEISIRRISRKEK